MPNEFCVKTITRKMQIYMDNERRPQVSLQKITLDRMT